MHMPKSHCSQEAICQGNFLCYALLRIVELDSIFHRSKVNNGPFSKKCSFLCHNTGIHWKTSFWLSIQFCKKPWFDNLTLEKLKIVAQFQQES